MKILCADALADELLQPLRDAGHEVCVEPDLDADSLPARLEGDSVEVLVVRSTKVTEELVEWHPSARRLAYVAGGELPPFILSAKNRWSLEEADGHCLARCHASIELPAWAVPFAALLVRPLGGAIRTFGQDLQARMRSVPPRPVAGEAPAVTNG